MLSTSSIQISSEPFKRANTLAAHGILMSLATVTRGPNTRVPSWVFPVITTGIPTFASVLTIHNLPKSVDWLMEKSLLTTIDKLQTLEKPIFFVYSH